MGDISQVTYRQYMIVYEHKYYVQCHGYTGKFNTCNDCVDFKLQTVRTLEETSTCSCRCERNAFMAVMYSLQRDDYEA